MNNRSIEEMQKYKTAYEDGYKRSYTQREVLYQPRRKKVNINWPKLIAFILGCTMIASAFAPTIKAKINHAEAQMYADQTMSESFKHYDAIYDYTYYDLNKCARDIINYVGPKDAKTLIYSYYLIFDIDVEKQMNSLFGELCKQIDRLSEDPRYEGLKFNYYYETFADYLKAKGYTSIDEYKKDMDKKILALKEQYKAKEVAEEYLDLDESWRMHQ